MKHILAVALVGLAFTILGICFAYDSNPVPPLGPVGTEYSQCCTREGRCGYPFPEHEDVTCAPGTAKFVSDGTLWMTAMEATEISTEDFQGEDRR